MGVLLSSPGKITVTGFNVADLFLRSYIIKVVSTYQLQTGNSKISGYYKIQLDCCKQLLVHCYLNINSTLEYIQYSTAIEAITKPAAFNDLSFINTGSIIKLRFCIIHKKPWIYFMGASNQF